MYPFGSSRTAAGAMSKHPCANPMCPELLDGSGGLCGACRQKRRHGRASGSRRYGARWDRVSRVQRQLERVCRICWGEGRRTLGEHTDHIIPYWAFDRLRLEVAAELGPELFAALAHNPHGVVNLQVVCAACHSRKTQLERSVAFVVEMARCVREKADASKS